VRLDHTSKAIIEARARSSGDEPALLVAGIGRLYDSVVGNAKARLRFFLPRAFFVLSRASHEHERLSPSARSGSFARAMLHKRAVALSMLTLFVACTGETVPPDKPCDTTVLFGRPNDKTGLTDAQCQPRCACSAEPFEAPDYTEADAAALLQWTLLDPPAELLADPYASPAPPPGTPDEVCAVLPDPVGSHEYHLRTYANADAAKAEGAIVTHFGVCGLCSTLADLAVYMRELDLTTPVRECGIKYLSGPADALTSTSRSHLPLPVRSQF